MNTNHFLVYVAVFALLTTLAGSVGATCTDDFNTVTIGRWGDINTFDPAFMTSTERELPILNCIFNGLVKYKPGSWEVIPDLAKSWDISGDQKSITFHLRKGVQFHKGYGELTAEDVKFSFERILSEDLDSPYASDWNFLDHVKIVDEYTVKLILKEPAASLFNSTLPMNSGFIVSKTAVTEMGREKFAHNPIGTGPFEIGHWVPKAETLLERFDRYWDTKPEVEELVFRPIPEISTLEMALRAGELDIGRISLKSVRKFENSSSFNVHLNPGLKYYWLGMTVNRSPFDQVTVREAVRYAVDVPQLIEAAFFGYADQSCTILTPGMVGYWEDAPCYDRDIAKARNLLSEAGYPNGFEATCFVPIKEKEKTMAEVLQAQLYQVGISLKIRTMEIGAFNESINLGEADMYIQFYGHTSDPAYGIKWFTCDKVGKANGWNPSQWCDPEYKRLWKRAQAELNQEERAQIYLKMQKLLDESAWAVWLTNGVRATVSKNSLDLGKLYPNGFLAPWLFDEKDS